MTSSREFQDHQQAPQHPLLVAAREIDEALTKVRDVNPCFMETADKSAVMLQLAEAGSRLHELRLRLLVDADDVAETSGARDAASWLAHASRSRPDAVRADARLAEALDRRHLDVGEALRDGRANLDQAQVIVRALEKLPREVDEETRQRAEQVLVGHCAELTPAELAKVGRHILEHVAPEVAEEALRRQLEDEEKNARDKQRLHLKRRGDGTTRIGGILPDAVATRLALILEAYANPRKHAEGMPQSGDDDAEMRAFLKLPYPRRLAEAFGAMLESLDPNRLPVHGGDATTLVVTIGLDELKAGLAGADVLTAQLPGDDSAASIDRLSAGDVRRLACTAHIVPAVLGSDSEVLDLGRRGRLFSAAQRKAMLIRDRQCRAQGCDIPGTWTEAHHWLPWSQDGPTDLDNGVLLCRHHHLRAHDPAYSTERLANGDVRFVRRR